jgi:hypothetical protein
MTDRDDQAMEIAYLALGRLIAAECPAGFATASLHMDSDDRQTSLWIGVTQPDGTRVQFQPGPDAARNLLESLRGIRNATVREGGTAWRSCVVTLKAGGHFAIEVED